MQQQGSANMEANGTSSPTPGGKDLRYMSGFGNHFETEAVAGALPVGQNNPQRCPFNLYAEQISGTAFTMDRSTNQNLRTWVYRVTPSVMHEPYALVETGKSKLLSSFAEIRGDPNQMRWNPMPLPAAGKVDFIDGMTTMAGSGDASSKNGLAIHMFTANTSMERAMQNSDGDFLIVPQEGELKIQTELGILLVCPREICVIPRGIVFSVKLLDESARGYILEVFNKHFVLPSLGPIGANGLANPRDFLYPVAAYEHTGEEVTTTIVNKFCGSLYQSRLRKTPFDVVAWHGNYAPYKYDLERFNTMGSISYDHPDPSIFTVLTCPGAMPGEASADFVIFPPRWMVAEKTFRPPYFHRNCMSEFMGMIHGCYDAKQGFRPGGASLHTCMTPHGPDKATFDKASTAELSPDKFEGGLAFMFESAAILKATPFATEEADWRDREYQACWEGFTAASVPLCPPVP